MPNRLAARASVAAAIALALGLSGCTRSTDFSITEHYADVAVNRGVTSGTSTVDLAAKARGAWNQREHVKSLDLVGLDATVTKVTSGAGTVATGTVSLSRQGTAIPVGTWTEALPAAVPHSAVVTLKPDAVQIVDAAMRDDGKFDVVFVVSSAGAAVFDADVTLHVHMTYKFP